MLRYHEARRVDFLPRGARRHAAKKDATRVHTATTFVATRGRRLIFTVPWRPRT